jgi:hypothetical protein
VPAIEEDEAEVSVHVIEHRDGWSEGTAVAAELQLTGHGDGALCAARACAASEARASEREMKASARLLHSTRQHAGVVMGDDGAWSPRGREVGVPVRAWLTRIERVSPIEVFCRARGGQESGQGGRGF